MTGPGPRRTLFPMALFARKLALSALVLASLTGCGGDPSRGPGAAAEPLTEPSEPARDDRVVEEEDSAGASRGQLEGSRATIAPEPGTTVARPEEATVTARPLVTLTLVTDLEAEDGAGGVAHAAQALAFELDARSVPPRALDPVLHVGELRARRYAHPRPGVLRFVLATAALPTDGVAVFVQYGEDETTRRELGTLGRGALALPTGVR